MLIRHPNSARGNDLYETHEVAIHHAMTRGAAEGTVVDCIATSTCPSKSLGADR